MKTELDHTKTNHGMHKTFLLSRFPDRERNILERLKNWWYLTHSGRDVVLGANAKLSYFLMKPVTSFAEMFNLDREIVCVFSPYPNFEPRSFDAFDAAEKEYQSLRLETICRVLISDDPKVEEKVENLLKADPEQPIVIPFTYAELINCPDEYVIRNKFRKHFYTRDLFAFLSPLKKDLYFFGRAELVQNVISRHRSGEHSSLFGLRKSGKTSVIYAVERFLQQYGDRYVSIDCESPSIHQLRWNEMLHKVVVLYFETLNSKAKPPNLENYSEKNAADQFSIDMLRAYESKKKLSTLIIFDEIERISPQTASSPHWRDGDDFIYFFQTLRAFYQRNPSVFTYMIVGTNPIAIESSTLNGHENPIFKSIPSTYMPPFDVTQVRQMVRKLGRYMGLKFDESIYGLLHNDFGGHPFLIRQVCSEINKHCTGDRPQVIDKPLYEKVKANFEEKTTEYLDMMVQILRDWYPEEYDVLSFLAIGDMDSFNMFASSNPSYTQHLIGYGLVQKSTHGFAFNIELIKPYLQKVHKYEKLNLTKDEKVSEISIRRNKIEKALRDSIRTALKLSLGKRQAAQKVLHALPEDRRKKLEGIDLELLLSRDESPLFFLDLANLVRKEWGPFQNLFDGYTKEKITIVLDEINASGRPDAHAKYVTEDEFTQLRLHFKLMEGTLADWI